MGLIEVRPLISMDRQWLSKVMRENWGSDIVVSRGRMLDTRKLPGFVAVMKGEPVAELTYNNEQDEFEIVTVGSMFENTGVGSGLIQTAKE